MAIGRGRFDLLCEVTPLSFDRLMPNQGALGAFDCRGIVVTTQGCKGSLDEKRVAAAMEAFRGREIPEIDFRSRFFGPRCGVPEDPVTGSAHCMLAPYWAKRLGHAPDASRTVFGFQASKRGGIVRCEMDGSEGLRVMLSGQAITTLEGTMFCG